MFRGGFEVRLYKDVASILEFIRCYLPSTKLALASRTPEPEWASGIISKLEITPDLKKVNFLKEEFGLKESHFEPSATKKPFKEYFSSIQLYPGNKLPHFRAIQKDTSIAYDDMVFYDDEPRNIKDVNGLGVFSVLAGNGLTIPLFVESITKYISSKN
ncbi:Magnesium-dependent phosphatase 1, variant 2 [Entomophthora muscae]|uniref:Magnesium-dependent phosphatase 1, variant 2 n=1 Tax=Entomophthora muscae TaxID=34485 RepID=A0ACC2SRL4_9FUNG|nr:Magnesium-dependent phosphatase 1, variant 2 [Entomophthora muscae]